MKTEPSSELSAQVARLIDESAAEAHGVQRIAQLGQLLKDSKVKTEQIMALLRAWMYCAPVQWEQVKDRVWESDKERNENCFPFLQGDLLRCGFVQQVGVALSAQRHQLWLARTPTCDLVRKPFIQLAPVFQVFRRDQKEDPGKFSLLRTASFFSTTARFPLPPLPDDAEDVLGYVADLTEPCFLLGGDRRRVTVLSSLSLRGWHLWNLCLKHGETRANMADEIRIRSATSQTDASP